MQEQGTSIIADYAEVSFTAQNLYEDIQQLRGEAIGTRQTVNISEDTRINQDFIIEDDEQYALNTYIQGQACAGQNEIVNLVGGIAICCGSCPADIQLEFPADTMCSLNEQTNWLRCNNFYEGTLHSVATECTDNGAEVALYDDNETLLVQTGPAAQWGEYMVFELREGVDAGRYTLEFQCDGQYTRSLFVGSYGPGGGGGGGGAAPNNNGDDDNNNGGNNDPFSNFQWPPSNAQILDDHFIFAWHNNTPKYPTYDRMITMPQVRNEQQYTIDNAIDFLTYMPDGKKTIMIREFAYNFLFAGNPADKCIDPDTGEVRIEEVPGHPGEFRDFDCFWREGGVADTQVRFHEIMSAFSDAGQDIDYIILDTEESSSMWVVGATSGSGPLNVNYSQHWNVINDDPRFNNVSYEYTLLPNLIASGYTPGDARLNDTIGKYGAWAIPQEGKFNYLHYNSWMHYLNAQYLTQATYDVAKQYYPDVKLSDYGYSLRSNDHDYIGLNGHDDCNCAQDDILVGTHQAPQIYGWMGEGRARFDYGWDGSFEQHPWFQLNPYNAFRISVNKYREAHLADPTVPFTLWISKRSWGGDPNVADNYLVNSDYYQEKLLHTAMVNTEAFIYWNHPWSSDSLDDAQLVNDVIKEADAMTNYMGTPLVNDLSPWENEFIVTTKDIGNYKISRMSPMMYPGQTIADVTRENTNDRTVAVRAGNETTVWVEFTDATVVEYTNTVAPAGQWIVQTGDAAEPQVVATCGNGIIEKYETCDSTDRDICSATCESLVYEPVCGNGIIDQGELCDDGDTDNNNYCTNSCTIGNALAQITACNDGIDNDGDGKIDWPFDHQCSSYYDDDETTLTCDGDQQYLMNTQLEIITDDDGTPSFNLYDDSRTLIRRGMPNERFLTDLSGGLVDIEYEFIPKCGGVDIPVTLHNPTTEEQQLADFRIDGIVQSFNDVRTLNTFRVTRFLDLNTSLNYFHDQRYPDKYLPATITVDDNLVFTSMIAYPYLEYKHSVIHDIKKWESGERTGTWTHLLQDFNEEDASNGQRLARLQPGETRTYTIMLRASEPDYYLYTLWPYKQFFNYKYKQHATQQEKNDEPILGIVMGDASYLDLATNPRGFNPTYRPDERGWEPTVSATLQSIQGTGFNRVHYWVPHGRYFFIRGCNQPPGFMDWMPQQIATDDEFDRIGAAGIRLGYWWGRSGQVPLPDVWDASLGRDGEPSICPRSDPINNASNKQYQTQQIALAYSRGAKDVGLDAFGLMKGYNRWLWIDELKELTNNEVLFYHEAAGPDFTHAKIGNVFSTLDETYRAFGPDIVADYLNPQNSFWAHIQNGAQYRTREYIRDLIKWGFAPVPMHGPTTAGFNTNITNIDRSLVHCYDGIDNDGDGNIDYPHDADCLSYAGTSERGEPTAHAIVSKDTGVAPLEVHFDAINSLGGNSDIVAYRWDFDGDNTFDLVENETVEASHTYTIPRPQGYLAKLQVENEQGQTNDYEVLITVASDSSETWSFSVNDACRDFNFEWAVTGANQEQLLGRHDFPLYNFQYQNSLFAQHIGSQMPYIKDTNGDGIVDEVHYGGVPQAMNLTQHLDGLRDRIRYVRDTLYDLSQEGTTFQYMNLDYEHWHPIFRKNSDLYINYSKDLVRAVNPTWTEQELYDEAERQFESAARDFFLESLRVAKEELPQAKWGFYGFPHRSYWASHRPCQGILDDDDTPHIGYTDCQRAINDELSWMWQEIDYANPSIYQVYRTTETTECTGSDRPANCTGTNRPIDNLAYVHENLQEAIRIADQYNIEVVPYVWSLYHDSNANYAFQVVNEANLRHQYEISLNYTEIDGLMNWGYYGSGGATYFDRFADHLQDELGPYVQQLKNEFDVCTAGLTGSVDTFSSGNTLILDATNYVQNDIIMTNSRIRQYDANVAPDPYIDAPFIASYTWDVGSDGSIEGTQSIFTHVTQPTDTSIIITLTITNSYGVQEEINIRAIKTG